MYPLRVPLIREASSRARAIRVSELGKDRGDSFPERVQRPSRSPGAASTASRKLTRSELALRVARAHLGAATPPKPGIRMDQASAGAGREVVAEDCEQIVVDPLAIENEVSPQPTLVSEPDLFENLL